MLFKETIYPIVLNWQLCSVLDFAKKLNGTHLRSIVCCCPQISEINYARYTINLQANYSVIRRNRDMFELMNDFPLKFPPTISLFYKSSLERLAMLPK